jgi:hypothetical protein
VRLLTPEVRQLFEVFKLTHELSFGHRIAQWQRIALPEEGSLGEQDALLIEQLDAIKDLANELITESARKGDPRRELDRFREQQRAERGE